MSKYAKLTSGIIGAWFVFSLVASALHLYTNGPNDHRCRLDWLL